MLSRTHACMHKWAHMYTHTHTHTHTDVHIYSLYIYLSFWNGTSHCKSFWIEASAKCPKCKCSHSIPMSWSACIKIPGPNQYRYQMHQCNQPIQVQVAFSDYELMSRLWQGTDGKVCTKIEPDHLSSCVIVIAEICCQMAPGGAASCLVSCLCVQYASWSTTTQ